MHPHPFRSISQSPNRLWDLIQFDDLNVIKIILMINGCGRRSVLKSLHETIQIGVTTMQTYHGSCHCGAVKYEVDADLSTLERCTCSICSKKGGLFVRVPQNQFRMMQGQNELVLYQFNTGIAEHYFCKHCGIHPFGHPRSAPDLYLINVRCFDDFDLEADGYEIKLFDGKNWEAAFAARQAGA
jgi:hypothetical protein